MTYLEIIQEKMWEVGAKIAPITSIYYRRVGNGTSESVDLYDMSELSFANTFCIQTVHAYFYKGKLETLKFYHIGVPSEYKMEWTDVDGWDKTKINIYRKGREECI